MPAPFAPATPSLHRRALCLLVPLLLAACQGPGISRPLPPVMSRLSANDSDQQQTYLRLIGDMQRQGAWPASLAHIRAFRDEFGDSPALQLLQAEALRSTGQPAPALALYRQLLTTPATAAAAWHGIGLIQAASAPAQALQALDQACRLAPGQPSYWSDLGYQRLREGAIAQAAAPLQQAQRLAPHDPNVIARLALYQLLSGQPQAAEQRMREAGLSGALRESVYRQAERLPHLPATAVSSPLPHAAAPLGPAPARPAPAAGDGLIPASMLERFGAAH